MGRSIFLIGSEYGGNLIIEIVGIEKTPIGIGSYGKASGYPDP